MKKFNIFALITVFLSILILTGCAPKHSNDAEKSLLLFIDRYTDVAARSDSYSSATPYEYFIQPPYQEQLDGQNVSFQYTFDTGVITKNIYFIFTNISPNGSSSYPIVSDMDQNISQNIIPETGGELKSNLINSNNAGIRGKPEVSEFNRNPYAYLDKINPVKILLNNIASPSGPRYDSAGDPIAKTFYIDSSNSISAHCKYSQSFSVPSLGKTKTLNIWVADNCWVSGGTKTKLVDQTMVNELASKFLAIGNNDIYDWVTNIYGEEWGSLPTYAQSDLISETTSNNQITILLFDIDNDNSTSGGVLGYFWSKDNFQTSRVSYSNQRIMFYLDAVLLATNEGTWDITDKWPAEIVSTLAHEFQHMIHFYQKNVWLANGVGTETWIDEMCSLVTEDLVADKLGMDGPRGVDPIIYLTGSAGPLNNPNGRLPIYNYFNDASVTTWYGGNNVLISYSINYALGAYLARNYGGAQFFHDVVHNQYTDYRAIETVLANIDSSNTFGIVLQKWGIANLLSDTTPVPGYQYNTSTWFTDLLGYSVGSINLYNYIYHSYIGPYIYTTMPSGTMPQASNEYYHAASLNGSGTWNIKLKSTVRLTVLAK